MTENYAEFTDENENNENLEDKTSTINFSFTKNFIFKVYIHTIW